MKQLWTQGGQLELVETAARPELQPAGKKGSLLVAGQLGRARGTNPHPLSPPILYYPVRVLR